MFNSSRLSLARRRRGMTKKALAEAVGVTSRAITAFEAGDYEPGAETAAAISRTLDFPPAFFEADDMDVPEVGSASFRSMSRMTAGVRHAALAAGAIAFAVDDWVKRRFELPPVDLPDLPGEEPEGAAAALRQCWGLGERPIRNTVHLLEAKGVRVFSLGEDRREVDALSLWRNEQPYVFLNTFKSAERSRFDAAHELAHLVLHKHGAPSGQDAEKEANRFASAFLMSEGSVRASAPRMPSLKHLVALKTRWIVSVSALAYRLHALKLLSDWHHRTIYTQIAANGYLTSEPNPSPRETSQVWAKVFATLRAEGTSKHDLATELSVPVAEVEKLVFGLVMVGMTGASGTNSGARARVSGSHLKLVI